MKLHSNDVGHRSAKDSVYHSSATSPRTSIGRTNPSKYMYIVHYPTPEGYADVAELLLRHQC